MNKIPVIIDCDTGIDDMISFAVTLTSDKLNILGITTAAGNQVVDITTQNTLNGVTIMGRTDIPVARGAEKPLSRPLRDAGYIHGENGLGTYQFAEITAKQPEDVEAVELMRRLLAASDEKVVILAIAPLTNVDVYKRQIILLIRFYPDSIRIHPSFGWERIIIWPYPRLNGSRVSVSTIPQIYRTGSWRPGRWTVSPSWT